MNGHAIDLSKIGGNLADDALSNRLRAELDRSIAKHLEAGRWRLSRYCYKSDRTLKLPWFETDPVSRALSLALDKNTFHPNHC